MYKSQKTITSKFLSLVLRHRPELIGLNLDAQGWVDVEELIQKIRESGRSIDLPALERLVETNEKRRFSFNNDNTKIRANQGHSVKIDLGLNPEIPPQILYHGTGHRSVNSILQTGLHKGKRHHVHLSSNIPTAIEVGKRHGKPVVFEVCAGEMHKNGYKFFISENGVWLTEEVPARYLQLLGSKEGNNS